MSETATIQVLPDAVANQIAAGEVVERPASVLKELLENAVDAGASRIDVEVVAGGRKLVSVTDNGSGMSRDDALLSVERHATSKIREVHDIECIQTLGFRGEALAAIASVSRFRLQSCRAGALEGTVIEITGGRIQDVSDAPAAPGTCIEVRDLFFNVPARKKFLRTHQTELSHLRNTFLVQALAYPSISMTLTVDSRQVYELAGDGVLKDRLAALYGREYCDRLLAVDYSARDVHVAGFISPPDLHRADRDEQYLFVNGRPATAPVAYRAIREGFRGALPADRQPSLFLFLEMAHDLVDVNVHPTKKEVRFRKSGDLRDTLAEAIETTLSGGVDVMQSLEESAKSPSKVEVAAPVQRDQQMTIIDLPPAPSFRYPGIGRTESAEPEVGVPQDDDTGADGAATPWSTCRVLGQVGDFYVLLETDEGYVVMDPRASHERVLFERYMRDIRNASIETQALLLPETVELPPRDADRVRRNVDLLARLGFGISDFGGNAFVVDALPSAVAGASPSALLSDLSSAFEERGSKAGSENWQEDRIARSTVQSAVRSRDRLSLEEIERLVVDLAQADMPYTCPSGRPTILFTSFNELNRKFGRVS